jgi:hypothetical protein
MQRCGRRTHDGVGVKQFVVLGVGLLLVAATLPGGAKASASFPNPNLLVSQARVSLLQQYHAFHVYETRHTFIAAMIREHSTTSGVVLMTPFAVRLHTETTSATEPTPNGKNVRNLGDDLIQIRNRAWTRSAATKGTWKVATPIPRVELIPLPGDALTPSTLAIGVRVASLVTDGTEMFQGVLVWHIRGTLILRLSSGRRVNGHVAYLIGSGDHLPYLETGWYRDPSGGHDFGTRIVMSRFGETVSIFPPSPLPLP